MTKRSWHLLEAGVAAVVLSIALAVVLPKFRDAQFPARVRLRGADLQAVVEEIMAYEIDRGPFPVSSIVDHSGPDGKKRLGGGGVSIESGNMREAWLEKFGLGPEFGLARYVRTSKQHLRATAGDPVERWVKMTWAAVGPVPDRKPGESIQKDLDEAVGQIVGFQMDRVITYDISNGLDSKGLVLASTQHEFVIAEGVDGW